MGVLKCDCSSASAFLEKDGITWPSEWYAEYRIAFPAATLAALAGLGTGNVFAASFWEIDDSGGSSVIYNSIGNPEVWSAAGVNSPAELFAFGTAYKTRLGVFVADTWNTVKIHFDGTSFNYTINGSAVAGLSDTPGGVFDSFYVGGRFSAIVSGAVYYMDGIKIGTTDGGTDIFADDFESDLSGWDDVVGASSIVADPGFDEGTGSGFDETGSDTTTFSAAVRVGVAFNDGALEPNPTWTYLTDTNSLVASYVIDRGRQFEFDKTDGGTARVSINDREGLLDPTNSSGPYYGLLEPLLQIRLELWNPVTLDYHTRFRGWIESYDYTVEPFTHQNAAGDTVGVTRLQIDCVDIFEILTAIEMQPDGTFGDPPPSTPVDVRGNIYFPNEDAQTRISGVLTNAGIDPAFYVVFTLNVNMQASVYSPSENPLQVVQDAADAEFPTVSNVYTDRFGRLAVHGRLAKFDPDGVAAGASAGAWDFHRWKAGDGKAVSSSPTDTAHIRTFAYNRGLDKIINSALCTPNGIDDTNKTTVTGADIADEYVNDPTSIGQFGYRSWSAENLLIGAPSGELLTASGAGLLTGNSAMDECLAYTTYIVENYKQARNRVTDISFRSMRPTAEGAAANWDMLCKADISDVVEVTVRGPGNSPTEYIFNGEEFFIEGIHEEATPLAPDYANVTLRLDLSPKAYFPIGGGGGVGG